MTLSVSRAGGQGFKNKITITSRKVIASSLSSQKTAKLQNVRVLQTRMSAMSQRHWNPSIPISTCLGVSFSFISTEKCFHPIYATTFFCLGNVPSKMRAFFPRHPSTQKFVSLVIVSSVAPRVCLIQLLSTFARVIMCSKY
jgi:hypothetical protein